MALYIGLENQRLIWNSMMKIPIFQHYKSQNQSDKERWFYGIMQKMANTIQSKTLTVQDLQQLNRETVANMISTIKEEMAMQPYQHFDKGPLNGYDISENKTVTRGYISEQKQGELNKQFSDRQKDYQTMLKNEPVQEIHFHLEEDKPIDNMEELIKSHMLARSELTLLVPPPPVSPDNNITISPSKKVHWSIEHEQIEPVKIDVLPNLGQDIVSNTSTIDFQVFREFMIETRDFMKTMFKEMEQLKQTIANR